MNIDEHARALFRCFRVMNTVKEMLVDRGYSVNPDWCPKTMDEFKAKYCTEEREPGSGVWLPNRPRMFSMCPKNDVSSSSAGGNPQSCLVFFDGEESFKLASLQEYQTKARAENAQELIIVIAGKMNPIAKRHMDNITNAAAGGDPSAGQGGLSVQIFEEDDLIVNITKHELVPEHKPLSKEETSEILKAYSLQVSMLPRILAKDPVALYFGLKRGDVVQITRKSETAGEYVTFRQVV